MWPACSAPIVGTRPTVCPSPRQRREVSSIAPGVSITTGRLAGAVLDLFLGFLHWRRAVGRVGVLRARERPLADLPGKLVGRLADLLGEVGGARDALWRLARGQ